MEHKEISHRFCFESYGVPIRIESNSPEVLRIAFSTARSALLGDVREIKCSSVQQVFSLPVSTNGECTIIQNGEPMVTAKMEMRFWKYFDSLVRILVAEFTKKYVFLHAGTVGWHGKALVLPGDSHFGKTTLVAELVRNGAEYYSDEYAVLDPQGLVHPFARPLSLRTDGTNIIETQTPVEKLNGQAGDRPLRVGMVLFTKYIPDSEPKYELLSTGRGVVEIIAQTIAIKRNTEFVINILKKAFSSAIIVKSPRPDAGLFARELLEFVDKTAI